MNQVLGRKIFAALLLSCMLAGCAAQPATPPDSQSPISQTKPEDASLSEQKADGIVIEQEMWDVLAVTEGKIFYASPSADIPVMSLHCYDVETGTSQELLQIEHVMRWSGDCVTAGNALFMVVPDASTEEYTPVGEIIGVENRVVRVDLRGLTAEIYDTYRSVDAITQLVPVDDTEFLMSHMTGDNTQLTNSIARYTIADKKITPIISKQMTRADGKSPWSSWASRQGNSTVAGDKMFSFCLADGLIYSVEGTIYAIQSDRSAVNEYAIHVYDPTGEQLRSYSLNKMKELTSMDSQNHNFFGPIDVIGEMATVQDYGGRTTILQLDPNGDDYTGRVTRMYPFYHGSPDPAYILLSGEDGLVVLDRQGEETTYRPQEPDTRVSSVVFYQSEAIIRYINEKTGEMKTVYYQDINHAFADWVIAG